MSSFLRISFLLLTAHSLMGQNTPALWLSSEDNGKTISTVIHDYETRFNLEVIFENRQLPLSTFSGITKAITFRNYLRARNPEYHHLSYKTNTVLILPVETAMAIETRKCNIIVINSSKETVTGRIADNSSGEFIMGANIYFPQSQTGAASDSLGNFRIRAKQNLQSAEVSYAGYEKQQFLLVKSTFTKDDEFDIFLTQTADILKTATVVAQRIDANVTDQRTGIEKLKIEAIKQLPSFLGEIDPVRSITTLPGVSSPGDLASGYNVRGGENSQNLILQDGAIIFNPTHLFGFFSSFNPDFISDVTLLKGGGPARYGGRVSSVLDIKTRNGDLHQYSLSGGAGLISSRLSLEGPIVKDKASFLIGGRIAYSSWFINSYEDPVLKNSYANFYDLTAKLFQQVNKKNFLSATAYYGFDNFKLEGDSVYSWQTQNYSFKWDHEFNQKSRSVTSLASSSYKSELLAADTIFGYANKNGVQVFSLHHRHQYNPGDKVKTEAGIEGNFSRISPGKVEDIQLLSSVFPLQLPVQKTILAAVFAEGSFDLGKRWALTAGVRYSHFFRLGEDKVYTFNYDDPDGRTPSVQDTFFYKKNELVAQFGGIEPRASIRFLAGKSVSFKAGYSRTKQYMHQVSPTVSPSPLDFWITSNSNILPQQSDQFSLGYFQNFKDNLIETSLEGFYKKTANTIDYIEGVDLNLNPIPEAGLTQGSDFSYGIEFLIKKKQGRVTGWGAYTYSRSYRVFDSTIPALSINNGKKYPSAFDQPHQFSFVLNSKLRPRLTLSTNFTYSSGRPITIPIYKYSYADNLSVNEYSDRNSFRIPDYHRLDISLTIKGKEIRQRKFSWNLILSVFNFYARSNAYAIYFDNFGRAFKTSILATAVPSATFNFKIK